MKKRGVRTLIVIVVIMGLVLAAYVLVNNFNVVEFLRRMHGG